MRSRLRTSSLEDRLEQVYRLAKITEEHAIGAVVDLEGVKKLKHHRIVRSDFA
jgi:hypothetical protein